MVRVDRIIDNWDLPGAFAYQGNTDITGMIFVCPCGCKSLGSISFLKGDWDWNGNIEYPTVKPSIQKLGDCQWHGYLTQGLWEDA